MLTRHAYIRRRHLTATGLDLSLSFTFHIAHNVKKDDDPILDLGICNAQRDCKELLDHISILWENVLRLQRSDPVSIRLDR